MPDVIVIGAGIIGASIALGLSRNGARVRVLDAGPPGGTATGASFGWINASFYLSEDHFGLRNDGISAWNRLEGETGRLPIAWGGCLWWEEDGEVFDHLHRRLAELGYDAQVVEQAEFAALAPAMAGPPRRALRFATEAAAELGDVARVVLARAVDHGADVFCGVRVLALETDGGRVRAVRTDAGRITADRIVIAAGTGASDLLEPMGVVLPMLRRPGVTVITQPVPHCLDHVMVAPGQEFRQLPDGRILAPTSANHQEDDSSEIAETLPDLAAQTLARLGALLPEQALRIQSTTLTMRPVPDDGLPVIGPAGPDGLYLAVMHSGVTLAAITAELALPEILDKRLQNRLGPYRPSRFQA